MQESSIVGGLRDEVQLILDSNREHIEKLSELSLQRFEGFFPLVLRAILRRQFDSLGAVVSLVDQDRGFAAGPILRPSCEELIWTSYLLSIPRPIAEKLILCMAVREADQRLMAQSKAAGPDGIERLGLTPYLNRTRRERRERTKELRDIGASLRWPDNTVKNAELPSVAWIAKKVSQQETYDLIYSATSRFVHFSPSELLRMAWIKDRAIAINSETFASHWSRFCLYWGMRIFSETAVQVYAHPAMPNDSSIDYPTIIAAAKRIGQMGIPPVITADELWTPSQNLGDVEQWGADS